MEAADHIRNEVGQIRELLEMLAGEIEKVKGLHWKILECPTSRDRIRLEEELAEQMSIVSLQSDVLRDRIYVLWDSVGDDGDYEKVTPKEYLSILNAFLDVKNSFKKAQVNFRDECELTLRKHLHSEDIGFSDEEVDKLIQHGDFSAYMQRLVVFPHPSSPKKVMQSPLKLHSISALKPQDNNEENVEEMRKHVKDVEKRHGHLMALEQYITDLHDFISNVHTMVQKRGMYVSQVDDDTEKLQLEEERAFGQLR